MPLTLEPGQWYGFEIRYLATPQERFASPIKVLGVEPLRSGHHRLRLKFFHADYPQGVQFKDYEVRVLHRSEELLLASQPDRVLLIFHLTPEWIQAEYPNAPARGEEESLARFLDRVYRVADGPWL